MEQSHNYPAPCMALAVDAEKAFDHVSWPFLLKTLDKYGFGPNFIRWIQLLYTASQSTIRVNGHISQSFALGRGTRQGCLLSLLLFALSMEPLAQVISFSNIAPLTTKKYVPNIRLSYLKIYLAREAPTCKIQNSIVIQTARRMEASSP